ncbi:S49 family peptidase [Oricola cellulosilytica]|uniref:S49 family peptidase n=1 Tax=Oricola cellulosilytica TaxID=1429082 RepID=A0A4R0PB34_9HYPH|nr:S49 family peptidase [Oricola cellulosilytica]TCD13440.1 S49 family peptidase [Oricola cellulosilytica]
MKLNRLLPKRMRKDGPFIPVVRLQGPIMSGGTRFSQPLSLATCAPLIEKAFADKDAPAVAFIVNSPGGSPVQSRLIHQRIRSLADEKGKPVLMFTEDVAASGGYMIAVAGDEIVADPSSIIGSIGVISAGFGFVEAIDKLGVERRVYTAGKNKSVLDPFQPEKKEDVERLKSIQLEIHQIFIDLVNDRRGDRLKDNPELFTGAFWAGEKARELGLVDHVGDIRAFVKQRFGEKAELRAITPQRNIFGRKSAAGVNVVSANLDPAALAHAATDGLLAAIEERALWGRFGL